MINAELSKHAVCRHTGAEGIEPVADDRIPQEIDVLETTLITDVELMEAVVETAAGSTPAVRYRVAAMSEAGRVVS